MTTKARTEKSKKVKSRNRNVEAKAVAPFRTWANKRSFSDSIMRSLESASRFPGERALEAVTKKLVHIALEDGHPYQFQAIKEIGDRLEGKPTVKVAGDAEGDPIGITEQSRELLIYKLNTIARNREGTGSLH